SGRTVSDRLSLAAISTHFINGGDPERDIEFRVQRLRDERSFANRRVDAVQGELLLSSALVSYLKDSPGLEHAVKPPAVADPETLPSIDEHLVGYEETSKSERLEHNRVWMKTHAALPDDPVLHSAALVYSSDTTVLDSIITTHGLSWGYDRIFAATINHSVWFHRPLRFDDWVLYATESPVASAGRGMGRHYQILPGAVMIRILSLLVLVLTVVTIISIIKDPAKPNGEKLPWAIIVLVFPIFGPILWFAIGKSDPSDRW
ncbi:Acyl-CoA thioesterase like protein, partial [Aduncisulcus paluster]